MTVTILSKENAHMRVVDIARPFNIRPKIM